MMRFLATTVLTILGNTLGIWLASLLLEGFDVTWSGLLLSVLFFTIAYIILSPFIIKMALRYVPVLTGGIALVTTLVVLLLTVLLTDGITIDGLSTWFLAPLVIWLTTVLAGVVLPLIFFKKTLQHVKQRADDGTSAMKG